MSGLLKPPERHNLQGMPDMQARRGAIEADVGADQLVRKQRVQRFGIGTIEIASPRDELAEEL